MTMFTPNVYFVTPVWKREALTKVCLEQRAEMLETLRSRGVACQAVVVGDDDNMATAEALGFETVELDNRYVASKFNAGYARALERDATHVMPVGSDSFLHPDAFDECDWLERDAYGLIGLSAMSPFGDERLDLQIKYPAGFGVGMVYPAHAIRSGRGADPFKNSGIDTSTWARCGRGRVKIHFQRIVEQAYVNFHSPDTQITSYRSLRGVHVSRSKICLTPWEAIEERYGEERTRAVMGVYAAHAVGIFLTGEMPVQERAHIIARQQDRALGRGRPPQGAASKRYPRGAAKANTRSRDRWGRSVSMYENIL